MSASQVKPLQLLVDSLIIHSTSDHAMSPHEGSTARLRMDGQLTDWKGNVRQVEVAVGPTTRRFALTDLWPWPDDLWDVAYQDTDDGRTVRPRPAGSHMSHEPWVFVSPLPCVPRDGVLHVDRDRKTVVDAETPIAP